MTYTAAWSVPKPAHECTYKDCRSRIHAAGLCSKHYQRKRKYGDPGIVQSQGSGRGVPAFDRFWSRVNRYGPVPEHRPDLGPCWLWEGPPNSAGYGTLRVRGQIVGAHRYACELETGQPVPSDHEPDHLCLVKLCVKASPEWGPPHLEVVTSAENRRRSTERFTARMAARTHCKYGHPWQPETTYVTPAGSRVCRICHPSGADARAVARLSRSTFA